MVYNITLTTTTTTFQQSRQAYWQTECLQNVQVAHYTEEEENQLVAVGVVLVADFV